MTQINLLVKKKQIHKQNRLVVAGVRGLDWESGISRCKLLYIEWINYKVLLCSAGNYMKDPAISHIGKQKQKVPLYKL